MTNPVPGFKITTPYRKEGPYWKACGWHTGVDLRAPEGTKVVAARPGVVRHRNYGSAFGSRQFAIVNADGSEDFYAHTLSRPANGTLVGVGATVARVGALGNATGPHLHFERHAKAGVWSCSNMRNPKASIDWEAPMGYWYNYSGKPTSTQKCTRSYGYIAKTKVAPKKKGLTLTKVYVNIKDAKFRTGQTVGSVRLRMTRLSNEDHTGYVDIPVIKGAQDAKGQTLATHVVFHNKPGTYSWSAKAIGGLESATLSTRYRSTGVVPE